MSQIEPKKRRSKNNQTVELGPVEYFVTWTAKNIQFLKPSWSLEECEEFLKLHWAEIKLITEEAGAERIEEILDEDYDEDEEEE